MNCEGCTARDEKIMCLQEQVIDLQIKLLKTLPQEANDMRTAGATNNPMFDMRTAPPTEPENILDTL